jgi:hypothetical protein
MTHQLLVSGIFAVITSLLGRMFIGYYTNMCTIRVNKSMCQEGDFFFGSAVMTIKLLIEEGTTWWHIFLAIMY